MSVQPQWVTAAGSLGTIPEGIFYSSPVSATADGDNVYFRLISGELPDGIQLQANGILTGVPKTVVNIQGVPTEVVADVTSRFAIRAYTTLGGNKDDPIDRLADRTFDITVTGPDAPQFITPAGRVGTFYDGTKARVEIKYTDPDPADRVTMTLLDGELPPGMVVNADTGVISGVIVPLVGPPGTAQSGYDLTAYSEYPFDFSTQSLSKNYQFTLKITDSTGRSNVRTFEIYVYSHTNMNADTEIQTVASLDPITGLPVYTYAPFTADNTFITADVVVARTPVLLTPEGDLGVVRADNWYFFKFDAVDFDGDQITYSLTTGSGVGYDESRYDQGSPYPEVGFDRGNFSLPPGLSIDPITGWFWGYIPDQGATEQTYKFAVRVYKTDNPDIISDYNYFTITITGEIDTEIRWITEPDLGTIANGAVSTLSVEAVNVGGRALQYRLLGGSDSRLPQGLALAPSGDIVGRVSFNTFALDSGETTFDQDLNTRLNIDETTFDTQFTFTVNAYSPASIQVGYQIASIIIIDGGSGYPDTDMTPWSGTVTISPPPNVENAVQATAGEVIVQNGRIVSIAVGNPGRGYTSVPSITITGGGGAGATAVCTIIENTSINAVSVLRTFTLRVNRVFNEPYQSLYIKCMPPWADRALIDQLIQNQDIFPVDSIYRFNDPNFGIAKDVVYNHAYGLSAASLELYVSSLDLNHYWKNLTLGEIRTAQALDNKGNVIYEVVYSFIIDDLVNSAGDSVSKEVILPYPINPGDISEIDVVYPNSLINMRDQVINTVGQINPALPLWMTSKQANGQILGFIPAWVIAYVKPGESGRVAYYLKEKFGVQLNKVDYKADRYELDCSQTYNWDPTAPNIWQPDGLGQWEPHPPLSTSFDIYSNIEYTTPSLNTDGRIGQTDQFLADGVSDRYRIDLLPTTDIIIVSVDGTIQTYNTDFTVTYGHLPVYIIMNNTPNVITTSYVGDGSTTAFAYTSILGRGLQVYLGLSLQTLGVDYTLAFNQVVFNTAPAGGYTVKIQQPSTITVYQIRDQYVLDPTSPPLTPTTFDGGSMTFNSPADRWTSTDEFDKYLVYPKTNILG